MTDLARATTAAAQKAPVPLSMPEKLGHGYSSQGAGFKVCGWPVPGRVSHKHRREGRRERGHLLSALLRWSSDGCCCPEQAEQGPASSPGQGLVGLAPGPASPEGCSPGTAQVDLCPEGPQHQNSDLPRAARPSLTGRDTRGLLGKAETSVQHLQPQRDAAGRGDFKSPASSG